MLRRILPAALLVLALLRGDAFASKPDAVAASAATAKTAFAAAIKSAETSFNSGTTSLVKALAKGATSRPAAVATYQLAVLTYANAVAKAADDAASAIETGATNAMTVAIDDSLQGAIVGDGGSLDTFSEYVESSLVAARAYALVRIKKFTKAVAAGSARTSMNVTLPAWTFERRAAPALNTPASPIGPTTDVIRMMVGIATRLDNGAVTVAFAGTAPKTSDGKFGVYLVAANDVRAVGKISNGGVAVTDSRTWSLTATLNDPTAGEAVNPGNRVVEFGVNPDAFQEPQQFIVGGVVGVE